jgi:hypothetical protein
VSGQSSTLVSQTIWGTTGHEAVDGVAVGPDGSIYLTGIHSLIGPPLKIFLVKFAANGSIAWQQTWDGPDPFFDNRPTDVAVSPDGAAVYVTGTSFFNPNSAVLLKFNTTDGSLIWDKSWGGTAFPQGVAVHTDGSIYVAGSIRPADIDQMFVTKFDAGGNVLWTRAWDTPESAGASGGEDVALDATGNVYVVGETPIPDPANPGGILGFQVALLKLDGAGNLLWQRTVAEGEQLDARGGLSVGADGSIYVAGARLDPRDSGFDGLVLKFAPDGTLVWNRAWGGRGHDEADGVAVRADGTVLVTGTTNSFSDGDDVFFLELQPGGKALDAAVWGNPGNATENGNAIAVSPVGDAVIGATVQDPPYAFLKAPTHTSRLRVVVGDPGFSLVSLAVDNVTAGGTVEPVAGTTNDDPGFDAAVIVIRP